MVEWRSLGPFFRVSSGMPIEAPRLREPTGRGGRLKKNAPKLVIHRETLRNLDRAALTGGQAAAAVSNQSPCLSIMDDCPSWGVSLCGGCEPTVWTDCPFINLTDTCAC